MINQTPIDNQTTAARDFYREIRKFAERTQPWQTSIVYETSPDERWDITLVSARVYGRRDEFLVIMAAAGLDMVDQELPQQTLVLPTDAQLYKMKRDFGFESMNDYRDNFKPTWAA